MSLQLTVICFFTVLLIYIHKLYPIYIRNISLIRKHSAVSGQRSAVSGQWSVVSGQWSAVSLFDSK
ncbi:hypothetical protein [Moorena sp. SIO2C4]|uniref:hypothetical protein n=1 Tax=Moorena sp. SIO2C4 TaxID=2607824 RepID=UPI0013C7D676|nr:hypothetical protein [Moorena sp. SIO2C4]NES43870.1 hypothetical protein [Moorena sp. SIO2C4]